jgi:hypothetical protein
MRKAHLETCFRTTSEIWGYTWSCMYMIAKNFGLYKEQWGV